LATKIGNFFNIQRVFYSEVSEDRCNERVDGLGFNAMPSPPPRGHVVPIRSVNENRALRQAAVFSGSAVGAHSPTKSPLEPNGLMVLPKAAATGNPSAAASSARR
jgi:hypothetical protein